jgi:putative membrane protein
MDSYLWVKSFHVISVIAWMAGLFYLPRLFVYHTQQRAGSPTSETFKIMERKLLRIIMNPAMIASMVTGGVLIWQQFLTAIATEGWLHAKVVLALGLVGYHLVLARWCRAFADDRNRRSEKFYRTINEVPTVLMILMVVLVIVRPF